MATVRQRRSLGPGKIDVEGTSGVVGVLAEHYPHLAYPSVPNLRPVLEADEDGS